MSGTSADRKWTDIFCRVRNRDDGTPRFSVIGAKSHLYEYDGYSRGHVALDRIIEILEKHGQRRHVSGEDSPLNISSFEYLYLFPDIGEDVIEEGYLRFTVATTFMEHRDTEPSSKGLLHFVGCSVNLELTNLVASKTKWRQSDFREVKTKRSRFCRVLPGFQL